MAGGGKKAIREEASHRGQWLPGARKGQHGQGPNPQPTGRYGPPAPRPSRALALAAAPAPEDPAVHVEENQGVEAVHVEENQGQVEEEVPPAAPPNLQGKFNQIEELDTLKTEAMAEALPHLRYRDGSGYHRARGYQREREHYIGVLTNSIDGYVAEAKELKIEMEGMGLEIPAVPAGIQKYFD